jgi:hypothetical protein
MREAVTGLASAWRFELRRRDSMLSIPCFHFHASISMLPFPWLSFRGYQRRPFRCRRNSSPHERAWHKGNRHALQDLADCE